MPLRIYLIVFLDERREGKSTTIHYLSGDRLFWRTEINGTRTPII